MKKLLSILLTFVMVFSFVGMSASATENSSNTGNGIIYLNNMNDSTIYKLYKVFDLVSVSSDGTAFSYRVDKNSKWFDFVTKDETATDYLTVDDHGGIAKTAAFTGDEATMLLAKAAIAYADTHKIATFATSESPDTNVYFDKSGNLGTFLNLPDGYYLFESTVGTLGALVTARDGVPAYIYAKNLAPEVDKLVYEDSIGESTASWLTNNSVDIGQEIKFDVTIKAQAGAENYAFHDSMQGMELWKNQDGNYQIEVIHHKNAYDAASGETQEKVLVKDTDYELSINPHEGVSFGIKFKQSFCDTIKANDKIFIRYSAVLTKDAVIAQEGNVNTCWVAYGAMDGQEPEFETAISKTVTHTYGVDVIKTNNVGESLPGAKFKLFPQLADGSIDEQNPIRFLYDSENQIYYVDPKGETTEFTVNTKTVTSTDQETNTLTGKFAVATLIGLDNGKYYLRETVAPAGYNMLTEDRVFTISGSNMKANFKVTGSDSETAITTYTGGGIRIENQKGDKLPETGGIGTTMFLTFGTITVLGAGVLLVTKKRMSMIED